MNSLPTISMDPKARYVTQSAAYDRLLTSRVLTDRRIAQLKAQGYYGGKTGVVAIDSERVAGRKRRKAQQQITVDELRKRYNI